MPLIVALLGVLNLDWEDEHVMLFLFFFKQPEVTIQRSMFGTPVQAVQLDFMSRGSV